jgi:heptosyltransferase-2
LAATGGLLLDAHAVLRSRALTLLSCRRPVARLRKDTALRRRLVRHGGAAADVSMPMPHLLDRFDALVAGAPGRSRLGDRPRAPLAHLRAETESHVIGLAPGARWETKRWPEAKFHELVGMLLETTDARIRLFVGPDEETWFPGSPLAALAGDRVEIVRESELLDVARRLGRCHRVVTNDSGLMHLAEAVGVPVTALFGPTVTAFGYAPLLPQSVLMETDLDCRPCSRLGSRPCHRGDLACLEGIAPGQVLATLLAENVSEPVEEPT